MTYYVSVITISSFTLVTCGNLFEGTCIIMSHYGWLKQLYSADVCYKVADISDKLGNVSAKLADISAEIDDDSAKVADSFEKMLIVMHSWLKFQPLINYYLVSCLNMKTLKLIGVCV